MPLSILKQSESDYDTVSTPSKKKRSLKAEKKQSNKIKQKGKKAQVKFEEESSSQNEKREESQTMTDFLSQQQDGLSQNNNPDETLDIERLTNKKKEYLQDAIIDKNGAYSYLEDP